MTSRQRSERTAGGEPAPSSEQPTVSLLTPEQLAARRAGERRRGFLRVRRRRRDPGEAPPRDSRGRRQAPSLAFAISGAVAAAYLALSLADGGFEPAVWAQATILVWWSVLVAILARAWPRSPIPAGAGAAGACLLALTVLTGASIAWTSDLGAAYEDALRGAGYLGVFALTAIAARAGYGRALLAGVATGLFAVCAIALLSRLEPGLVSSAEEARGLRVSGGRLSWPLGYWNAIGACAAVGVPLFIWLAASAATAWRRALSAAAVPTLLLTLSFSGSRAGTLAQAIAILVLLLAGPRRVTLVAIIAITVVPGTVLIEIANRTPELVNGENSAVAASAGDQLLVLTALASLAVGGVLMLTDRRVARLHVPVIGVRRATAAVAVIAVAITAAASFSSDPVERLRAFDDPPSTSKATTTGNRLTTAGSSGRVQFWDSALDAFESEPLRGIGAGGYESFWALNGSLDFTVVHAHSLFFESAAELGILGALLAIAIFAIPAISGVRRLRAPTSWADSETASGGVGAALAVLAAGVTVAAADWVWDLPAAFVPAIAAAAYLATPPPIMRRRAQNTRAHPGRIRRSRRAGTARRRRLARAGAVLAVFAAAAASISAAGTLLLSERALSRSERALAAGDLHEAVIQARDAEEFLPFAAAPHRQIALVEVARGRETASRRAITDAQRLAAGDWELWFLEAGIEFSSGHLGRGVYALNRAQGLNPKAPPALFEVPSAAPG